jgi:hypothetical protein
VFLVDRFQGVFVRWRGDTEGWATKILYARLGKTKLAIHMETKNG